MSDFSGAERRRDRELSRLVNQALDCFDAFDPQVARSFFVDHHIPSTVAARVLFHRNQRRAQVL